MTEPTAVTHPHNWAPSDSAAGSICLTPGCQVVRRTDQLGFDCGPCWAAAWRAGFGTRPDILRRLELVLGDVNDAWRSLDGLVDELRSGR